MPKVPDATVAAIFTKREQRRYRASGGGRASPWTPCKAPYVRVLIKIVAHKTKQLPPAAQALSSDSDSAEAEQFLTTRALCTPLKVAKHLGCDVEDLIHLNTVRYPAISGPRIQLQQKTRLLKPFRSRTVQGLVVAHNGSDQNERFRLAALDPDGINMPGHGINMPWVDDTVPENTCFEFEITRTQLDELDPKMQDGTVFGPVRLEPVADQWHDDDPLADDFVPISK